MSTITCVTFYVVQQCRDVAYSVIVPQQLEYLGSCRRSTTRAIRGDNCQLSSFAEHCRHLFPSGQLASGLPAACGRREVIDVQERPR